jgi:putative transposase
VFYLVVTAVAGLVGTVCGMSYSSDLTDEQWALLEPVFNAPGKRGPKHAPDLRRVVDAMLYVSHTGCQWRYLPESFGPWTRVWSQFRRWSRNRTWTRALTVLHAAAREAGGGFTFHDRGGPYGRTRGAKRVAAVDVTGLPVSALVVPASTHENRASELMLEHLTQQGVTGRLELVLVDRGVTAAAARALGRHHGLEMRRVGWDDKQPVFRPIRHAWRVEVAHGRLGRSRRLAKSFENTTASATGWLQVACIATTCPTYHGHEPTDVHWRSQRDRGASLGGMAVRCAPMLIRPGKWGTPAYWVCSHL